MNSIRSRAYAAAYKSRDDQSVFNPFAARRRFPQPSLEAQDQNVDNPSAQSSQESSLTSASEMSAMIKFASAREEAVLEWLRTLHRQSSAGLSYEMDETGAANPKPSEPSLWRTHSSAPSKISAMDGLSTGVLSPHRLSDPSKPQDIHSSGGTAFSALEYGPAQAQRPGGPVSSPFDDTESMRMFIKTYTGKLTTLDVTRNTTIDEVMMLYEDQEGISPYQQRSLFSDRQLKQLEPLRTLKDYNVEPDSTLYMVIRPKDGGGRGPDFAHLNKDLPPKPRYTFSSQMRVLFFNSYTHLLILFIPVGFPVYYCDVNPIMVLTINFLAIIPSAAGLAFGVDELSLRVGETLGGLISMTFSNAVQVITSIFLLKQGQIDKRQIDVLRTPLIGSILSNLLLMTGLGFFVGGLQRFEQHFNSRIAQLLGSLLFLAAMSIVVPTISPLVVNTSREGILRQAHGTAIMLLLSYCFWLYFQLRTHAELFREQSPHDPPLQLKSGDALKAIDVVGAKAAETEGGALVKEHIIEDEKEEPQLSVWTAIATIVISTVFIAFNTQFATESINGLLNQANLTPKFVGLVILPLLSNDPTTLIVAYKDKMDLSLNLTIGKCMQTAMMVVPLVVIIGWGMRVDMTLQFSGFEVASLFASILIVNYIVQDGRSTWIQGALLVEAYIIVAIAAYFVP